ncbi:hypothetical protein [Streptosporangium longisporum]|uniref:Thioredoxin domain-containing protein n=1 Tax=Streptosporangium longisporum TaxID=46187 RepID=A0ABP6KF55_9ACTN
MLNVVVVLVGAVMVLCAFDIVLTVGVARRLRAQGELLARQAALLPAGHPPPGDLPPVMREAGERLGAFRTAATDGTPLDEGFFADAPALVAAFSVGCPACEERLPEFIRFAPSFAGRERVLALVVGTDGTDGAAEKAALLEPVATVVVEKIHGGPVCGSLGVRAYPALAIVDPGGVVRASGTLLQDAAAALETV